MAENKTKSTGASVDDHLAARATGQQLADSRALVALFQQVTGQPAHMWGPSIVGFGSYSYTYESGHKGEAPVLGFAVRGRDIVVYVVTDSEEQGALLARIGKHKIGKACLYFKQLADLDGAVLEQLARNSVAEVRRRYG